MTTNYTLPTKRKVHTVPASQANQITKEYYNMLLAPINNGEIFKALCRIEDKRFGVVSYHLISV
jgi:hypothetical protein